MVQASPGGAGRARADGRFAKALTGDATLGLMEADFAEARSQACLAVDLWRDLGNERQLACAMNFVGRTHFMQRNPAEAGASGAKRWPSPSTAATAP